jgi:hypothetical protein
MKTDTRTDASSNGHAHRGAVRDMAMEAAPTSRRARVPELLLGLALVVGFALAALVWHANSTQRDAALALATGVDRGETITADHLEVVYLGTDDAVARLDPVRSVDIIGRVAAADLEAGTLVTTSHVIDLPTLTPGEGVVGLALDPGQYPAGRLSPGDLVNVVVPGDGDTLVIAEAATVFSVEDLGGQGRRFISLQATEDDANRVAAAAESGPVRLVLVGA